MVAGHEEVLAVLRDTTTFSNVNIVAGPDLKFSEEFEGRRRTVEVKTHRDELPMHYQIITFDPPLHTAHRALLIVLSPRNAWPKTKSSCGDWPIANSTSSCPWHGGIYQCVCPALHPAGDRRPAWRARGGPPGLLRRRQGIGGGWFVTRVLRATGGGRAPWTSTIRPPSRRSKNTA